MLFARSYRVFSQIHSVVLLESNNEYHFFYLKNRYFCDVLKVVLRNRNKIYGHQSLDRTEMYYGKMFTHFMDFSKSQFKKAILILNDPFFFKLYAGFSR